MAPSPTLVYNTNGDGTTANGYSCAACHTTGWSNAAAGVCYPDSTKDNSGYLREPQYLGAFHGRSGDGREQSLRPPSRALPALPASGTRTALLCSRCHAVTFPDIKDAAGNAITTTHETPSTATTSTTCASAAIRARQRPMSRRTSAASTYPANAKILDPAMIPTGAGHGANWGREFNGHVLGNSFLNSPHSRFTGTHRAELRRQI